MNKNKLIAVFSALVLVLLFLASTTNLLIQEKKREIYPISVIVEDISEDGYEKLKKGMDKAAEDFHVDLNFITLYEKNDHSQQMRLIEREIKDGAQAVVLSPADPAAAAADLEKMALTSPVIILGEMLPGEQVKAALSINHKKAGERLGESVVFRDKEVPVYLVTQGLGAGYTGAIYEGVRSALRERGYETILYTLNHADDSRRLIEGTVYPEEDKLSIIALDSDSLDAVAQVIAGSNVYGHYIEGFYGIGNTTGQLYYLDQDVIDGLVVYNLFDEGYLSIQKAVEAIQASVPKTQIEMATFYITKEQLRNPDYEKMLYPIE